MAFSDLFNYSFNYGEASEYVTQYWNELESVYCSEEAPSGTKGKVWRQFHGKPQDISPLTVYLSQKVFDLEESLSVSTKECKKFNKEAKKLKSRVNDNESELNVAQEKNKKLATENHKLKARLDDDTAKALMESIMFLSEKCKKSNLHIDILELPHNTKISKAQIKYLKSLVD
ncbi:hypothetical protein [Shewanella sedimentimangrovi]|uniref:Uncharacterized protein n=1 Tax=Shewanella sedimentimangrovi TaxID=2814293 RepID=A0ABX7R464_9GAMM|nr:hypothetical protein [Shewanella sedimentimangrovi]QSX38626.1 hypothetical protein JYB85_07380 [Shewanella sedimentimangrovi]